MDPQVLRLSITDRCNLRCRYCLPDGPVARRAPLPALAVVAEAAAWLIGACDVRRVKVTGGEPLVRHGVVGLVEALARHPRIAEVSMTTNGTRLAHHARDLKHAGLARINVSLDTLDRARFADLTQGARLGDVLGGIDAARRAGLNPVKLNAVLRRSTWNEDVPALLDFAAREGLELRFIELMPTGPAARWNTDEFVAAGMVRRLLEGERRLHPLPEGASAPARRTLARWRGRDVAVGWITPISHAFCDACDRLRLDAWGDLRRCMMDPLTLSIPPLAAADDASARGALADFLNGKRPPLAMRGEVALAAIGG